MSQAILFQALMFSWVFWVCLTLGCVGLLYLHHMLRATWGVSILRFLEAGTRTLLPMAVIFFIILFAGSHDLWPWAQAAYAKHPVVRHRGSFNSVSFVAVRSAFYFVFWFFTTQALIASAARQDRTGDPALSQWRANFASPIMVVHVLVTTLAFTDWVMSLDPGWFSTIFGAWFIVCQGLSALAFCTILMTRASINRVEPYAVLVSKTLLRDLGNLMLGFTMLWAYFSLSQFLIIWSGNLPEETGYYATRMSSDWVMLGTFLVFFSFFAPFLMLIYNYTKRNARALFTTACFILAVRVADMYWTIIPFFNREGEAATIGTHLIPSGLMFVLVGAVWLVTFRMALKSATPLPTHDPRVGMSPNAGAEAHAHA